MNNLSAEDLQVTEIKAFVPAKDFALSKQFYADLGFTQASEGGGVAYFYYGNSSFLLQEFYEPRHCENFMMHLLVNDAAAWHGHVVNSGITDKYDVQVSEVTEQPWKMLDFVLTDPSGVLWRIGQNV